MENKKQKLREDVVDFFEGDMATQRAYDALINGTTEDQLKQVDWEMLMMAIKATVADRPVQEFVETKEYDHLLKELDNELKNIGY